MIKAERKKVLDRVTTALGRFMLVLIGGGVVVVYIVGGSEANSILEPTIPLLIVGGFIAIGLIIGGEK